VGGGSAENPLGIAYANKELYLLSNTDQRTNVRSVPFEYNATSPNWFDTNSAGVVVGVMGTCSPHYTAIAVLDSLVYVVCSQSYVSQSPILLLYFSSPLSSGAYILFSAKHKGQSRAGDVHYHQSQNLHEPEFSYQYSSIVFLLQVTRRFTYKSCLCHTFDIFVIRRNQTLLDRHY